MISYQSNGLLISILSIAIVIGLTFMILRIAGSINRLLGQRGSMIVTRVFAVIVSAIAVQYIIKEQVKPLLTCNLIFKSDNPPLCFFEDEYLQR